MRALRHSGAGGRNRSALGCRRGAGFAGLAAGSARRLAGGRVRRHRSQPAVADASPSPTQTAGQRAAKVRGAGQERSGDGGGGAGGRSLGFGVL
jgi:NAD/NADP transhydrogenase alpha subunit